MTPKSVLSATVDDILGSPGVAARVSMPLVLGIVFLVAVSVVTMMTATRAGAVPTVRPVQLLPLGLGLIGLGIGFIWTAVAWHRHVILGEAPGSLLPRWPRGQLLGYVGRSILVFIVVVAASILPLILAAAISPRPGSADSRFQSFEFGSMPSDLSVRSIVVWVILAAVIWGVSLRAGLILPARAIDRSLTLGQAFAATKGRFLNLFAPLGLLIACVFAVLDLITSVFAFGGVTQLASAWLQLMIGIGILTQLHIGFFGLVPNDPMRTGDSAPSV